MIKIIWIIMKMIITFAITIMTIIRHSHCTALELYENLI